MGRESLAPATVLLLALLLVVPATPGLSEPPRGAPIAPLGLLAQSSPPTGSAHAPVVSPLSKGPTVPVVPLRIPRGWNETIAPTTAGPLAGPPTSATPVEPSPSLPPTTPVAVTLASGLINCCLRANFTLPNGNWSRIVLNYTGEVVGGVYDSSYRMYVDQVPVLFGTTPEYGIWTVTEDLTEYTALLRGSTNVTFLLGAATLGGHFVSNLTLLYYPVPANATAPSEPDTVIPLWYSTSFTSAKPTAYEDIALPTDAVNATLELWSYGFGADEFWYSTIPDYRAITVSSDGTPLLTDYPFPFINTGGIDLFLWRPVTAVATVSDPPQRFDLTGALPYVEGSHNLTVNFTGISSGSNWIVDGALLLYTNSSYTRATVSAYTADVRELTPRSVGAMRYDAGFANFTSTIQLYSPAGITTVTSARSERFSANTSLSANQQWENISMHARSVAATELSGPAGTLYRNQSFEAPFAVDLGDQFVPSSSTSNYPIYGNVTVSFLHGTQVWNETSSSARPGSPAETSTRYDAMIDANGTFTGAEELTGPNAAVLLSVSSISTENPRYYRATHGLGTALWSYQHRVLSFGLDPPGPDNAAPVTANTFTETPGAVGGGTATLLEVGLSTRLTVEPLGAIGRIDYAWQGLPPGCPAADTPVVPCTPSTSGTFPVTVRIVDALGVAMTVPVASLSVLLAPSVRIRASQSVIDAGLDVTFNASTSGGLPPYLCLWEVAGAPIGPPQSCALPLLYTTSTAGALVVNASLLDALGGRNVSTTLTVTVASAVGAFINTPSGPATSLNVTTGTHLLLTAELLGGAAPFVFHWYSDGSLTGTGSEYNLTVGRASSTTTIYVLVTDSGGGSFQTDALTIHALAASSPPGNPSAAPGGIDPTTVVVLIAAVGLAAVLLGFLLFRRPRSPRRA